MDFGIKSELIYFVRNFPFKQVLLWQAFLLNVNPLQILSIVIFSKDILYSLTNLPLINAHIIYKVVDIG